MSKSVPNNELNAMIPTANNVANGCHQDVTAGGNIAAAHVAKKPTGNGKKLSTIEAGVSPTSTKPNDKVTRPCQQCGREMVVKRPSKQYCNAACRRKAWLQRNPEKAAALAASDKERLRAHLESRGIAWVERGAA